MKKRIAICCGVAMMAFGGASVALAGDHDALPAPGSPGCHGQVMAALNAAAKGIGIDGIGNLAVEADFTVQQVQQIVDTYCAG